MTIQFTNTSSVKLINFTGGDEMVARAAWVSNLGREALETEQEERIGGLINFLYSNSHNSPFEHGQFTFFVECPIFVAREFHRHRTWGYNETSGRYKTMEPYFYIAPPERPLVQSGKIGAYTFVPGGPNDYTLLVNEGQTAAEEDWNRYMRLKDAGMANEVARQYLPLNLMTSFYATVNPRNLMAFLTLREDDQALYEIREQVAKPMGKIFEEKMPLTNKAYRASIEDYQEFKAYKKWKKDNKL